MKDTLRVLVSWDCNLNCRYCCNQIPAIRNSIIPTDITDVEWDKYKTFCISGGEPLLDMAKVKSVCKQIPEGRLVILYTNGTLLTRDIASALNVLGVHAINVGLHVNLELDNRFIITGFASIIENVEKAVNGVPIQVRYHAQDIYKNMLGLDKVFKGVRFRYWKMNDCARSNEDRIVLK